MKSLLFFSHNQKKIAEVNQIFNNSFLKINSLKELKKIKEPRENGKTFAENAKIKSLFGFKIFNISFSLAK